MAGINDISRMPYVREAMRVSAQGQVQSPQNVQPYNTRGQGNATVGTSEAYQRNQSELQDLLKKRGFTADQAFKLSQIGQLNLKQFTRAMVIAQILMKQAPLFEAFVKILKNVTGRGHQVQESVRTFLDGLDQLLGQDTRKIVEQSLDQLMQERSPTRSFDYSPVQRRQSQPQNHPEEDFQQGLQANRRAALVNSPLVSGTPSVQTQAAVGRFQDFVEASQEGFPTRFAIDVFAAETLSGKGLDLENYVRLASEAPPLRLLNVLAQAERRGAASRSIINILNAAQEKGDDLSGLLETLEFQYGIAPPSLKNSAANQAWGGLQRFTSASSNAGGGGESESVKPAAGGGRAAVVDQESAFSLPGEPRKIPADASVVTILEGENAVLEFVGVDATDGVVSPEKSAFVVFPRGQEISGNVLQLAFLPAGTHMIMMAGVNSRQKMMNLWMKVVVKEDPQRRQSHEEDKESPSQEKSPEDNFRDMRDPLTSTFQGDFPITGPFLGEIVMPLDFANFDPAEMLVVSPLNGMIVSAEEFDTGVFPHHAVVFRFLVNEIETPDWKKRHQLLKLKKSEVFARFDVKLKEFVKAPAENFYAFREGVRDFFADLKKIFPIGEKSFAVAEEVLLGEAKAFSRGEARGELYDVVSLETRDKNFMAACYAKSACSLAVAGDTRGALAGLARASLLRWESTAPAAMLGEYINFIKDLRNGKQSSETVARHYESRMDEGFNEFFRSTANDADWGKRFIAAIDMNV